MKIRNLYITFFALFIALSGVRADSCQFTFKCQGSICERVQVGSCSNNVSSNAVVITSPPSPPSTPVTVTTGLSNSTAVPFVFRSADVSKSPENLPSAPFSGVGCAENG